ncbi:inosine monophosphate dehydrogenase [Hortaea werneckii]|nr:inosine monophosphate dehydrogenase [Hortaea werneckii]KAI7010911.1 inosine monophosphate dehydrogenase [Hortaea werneckii]KAI7667247.1 inosine monophosphate dehydrogenase [Hortaea werneckii]
MASTLSKLYPWVKMPLVVSAPMLGAATPTLAVAVSRAGGIGFVAGGTKFEDLDASLKQVSSLSQRAASPKMTASARRTLPIGVGFQLWGCKLSVAAAAIKRHLPAIAWLFAPKQTEDFATWSQGIRHASDGKTQIWVDAGGHGLSRSASVVSLVPEVLDMLESINRPDIPVLAAGGITEGRGVAAAVALGATGAVMGTRFLAAQEAGIAKGWQNEIIRAADGGQSTNRSTLCDRLKETKGWPPGYDGRAIENKGHEDEKAGMPDHENIALYKSELAAGDSAWGLHGRMVAYSGTGVGLVHGIKPAAEIVSEVHEDASKAMRRAVDLSVRETSRPNKL